MHYLENQMQAKAVKNHQKSKGKTGKLKIRTKQGIRIDRQGSEIQRIEFYKD